MTILAALTTLLSMQDLFSGDPVKHLTDGDASRVAVRTVNGSSTLSFSETRIRFRKLPVRPATKVSLMVEGAFSGDVESIEENPRLEILTHPGKIHPRLPARAVRFFDAFGKPVGRTLTWPMVFRSRHAYTDVFYTPPGAATLEIALAAPRGIGLSVSRVRLSETADEGALNSNPALELGLHNYSGWENISRGGKMIEKDGRVVLDTKYGSTTRKIPLPGAGRYAFSAKATGNGFNSVVRIRVYDGDGKKLMEMATRKYGPRVTFVPPKDAVYASFLVYSCLLEEVRLVRLGDE